MKTRTQVTDKWSYWDAKLKMTITLMYTVVLLETAGNIQVLRVINEVPVKVGKDRYYSSYNTINKGSEVFNFFKEKYSKDIS